MPYNYSREFGVNTPFGVDVLSRAACTAEEKRALLPLAAQILEIAEKARCDGPLHLEAALRRPTHPLLRKGVRMVCDNTPAAVMYKTLHYGAVCGGDRGAALLANLLVVEGVLAIQDGANPRIVLEYLLPLMGADFEDEARKYVLDQSTR